MCVPNGCSNSRSRSAKAPDSTALRPPCVVLAAGLDDQRQLLRWPVFAPAALDEGVHAVFAFPLTMGAASLGVLEIYRTSGQALSDTELDVALTMEEIMTAQVLAQMDDAAAGETESVIGEGLYGRWRNVHHATGMVAAQLRCTVAEALLRLRAYAYVTGRRLSEVADDVTAGVLRLPPDPPLRQRDGGGEDGQR